VSQTLPSARLAWPRLTDRTVGSDDRFVGRLLNRGPRIFARRHGDWRIFIAARIQPIAHFLLPFKCRILLFQPDNSSNFASGRLYESSPGLHLKLDAVNVPRAVRACRTTCRRAAIILLRPRQQEALLRGAREHSFLPALW